MGGGELILGRNDVSSRTVRYHPYGSLRYMCLLTTGMLLEKREKRKIVNERICTAMWDAEKHEVMVRMDQS